MTATESLSHTKLRFVYLDSLRGAAALAVVLYHLPQSNLLEPVIRRTIPSEIQAALRTGAVGVEVFFVLSGFVIAYSLRQFDGSLRSVNAFLIRRQVRIFPPYWAALAFVCGLALLHRIVPSLNATESISASGVFFNTIFLHRILGVPELLGVAWTLCIEVQFYIVFAAMLFFTTPRLDMALIGTIVIGLPTLFLPRWPHIPTMFYECWAIFALGVLAFWATTGRISAQLFIAFVGTCVFASCIHGDWRTCVACAVAASIYIGASQRKLESWLDFGSLRFLGAISYSLYLIHFPIELAVFRLGYKLTRDNPAAAVGYCFLSVAVSVFAAWVMFRFIEVPSIRLAARIGRDRRQPKAEPTLLNQR